MSKIVFKAFCACVAIVSLALVQLSPVARAQTSLEPPSPEDAPIALLVDVTSGQVLHSQNADRRFVPASITKAMTLLLAFEMIEESSLQPARRITPRKQSWQEWSGKGSTMFLPADEQVSIRELLFGIANISANDGSVALAEAASGSVEAWVAAMNAKAREIGMKNSYFGTPNGWPDEGRTFTTAEDLVLLGTALTQRHPDKFAEFIGKPEYTFNGITQPNRDPILGRVAGADGIKTGYTNESGFGFLGTAERDGQRLMMVVAGLSRNSQRAQLARSFMNWGFDAFERRRIFARGETVGSARVQGGTSSSLALGADRGVHVNVPIQYRGDVDMRIVYDGPLRAPIAAGDEVATLEIRAPGVPTASVPLVAQSDVAEAGFFRRIYNGLTGWI